MNAHEEAHLEKRACASPRSSPPVLVLRQAASAGAHGSYAVLVTATWSPLARISRPIDSASSTEPPPESMRTGSLRSPSWLRTSLNRRAVPATIRPWAAIHCGHCGSHPEWPPRTTLTCMGGSITGAAFRGGAADAGPQASATAATRTAKLA